jgi:hypothetical protein
MIAGGVVWIYLVKRRHGTLAREDAGAPAARAPA